MVDWKRGCISLSDKKYPSLLKKTEKAPEKLYYRGKFDVHTFEKCLAVVGSRKMTKYGKKVTQKLVFEIASRGITIVSGFMYGVDATAHHAALDAGGKTVAVMPCGVDIIHPAHQGDLYKDILDSGGLFVSEYCYGTPPQKWQYPERNRIVAGLSRGVLVVEAARNSGSLITASIMQSFERPIFSVPGDITSATSEGTLDLISDGATMTRAVGDIFKVLKWELLTDSGCMCTKASVNNNGGLENHILECILREPLCVDALSAAVETPVSVLNTTLTHMLLAGVLTEEDGVYYAC
jgi:DNA processing protein